MTDLQIRIKRKRTAAKDTPFEALERWASLEGRSQANALQWILESPEAHGRFHLFMLELQSTGKEPRK